MPPEPLTPATELSSSEVRNAKGEWRPPYPVRYAPVFAWPLRLVDIVKWLFRYPGFLWPTNLLLFAISAVSWYFTQPEVARCAQFEAGWILQVYLRNLVLMWIYYGFFHYYLYQRKAQGTKGKYDINWPATDSRLFLFRDQVYDNVFWTSGVALLVWTGFEVVGLWLYANHRVPWLDWATHPGWFIAWFFLIPFWREFHFYWVHRLIHWKPLYKRVHYLHHKNSNPNAWSGMAMHPVETIIYLSVCMIHWVVPSHPFHFVFDLQHAALGPAGGHHGFEGPILKGKLPTGSYFHYLHHRYFECNYGETTVPLDKWFGTFRDGLPEGVGSKLAGEHKD